MELTQEVLIAIFLIVFFLFLTLYFTVKKGFQKAKTLCDGIPKPICANTTTCYVKNGQKQWICDYYKMDQNLTYEPQNGAIIKVKNESDAFNICSNLEPHRNVIDEPACGWLSISADGQKGTMNYADIGDDSKDTISGFRLETQDGKGNIFKRFLDIDSSRVLDFYSSTDSLKEGVYNYDTSPANSIEDCEIEASKPYKLQDGRHFDAYYAYVFYPSERICKTYKVPENVALENKDKYIRN